MTAHVNVSTRCTRNEVMIFIDSLQLLTHYDNYVPLKNSSIKFQRDFYNLKIKFSHTRLYYEIFIKIWFR